MSTVNLHDPQTLYRHWEHEQWNPFAIDLAVDAEQWATMEDRALYEFVLGSLMVADSLQTPDGIDADVLGASTDELRAFALSGLTRRLNIIGVPLETIAG